MNRAYPAETAWFAPLPGVTGDHGNPPTAFRVSLRSFAELHSFLEPWVSAPTGDVTAQDLMTLTLCSDLGLDPIRRLLAPFGLHAVPVAADAAIPGSYWGASEAGLISDRLYLRRDTPVHSALHEACHYVCMDATRRSGLDTDAGGDVAEENAVCYLQILLADALTGYGQDRLLAEMDAWGYSFRLGSARAWFEQDAEDARAWLMENGLIDPTGRPTGTVRR